MKKQFFFMMTAALALLMMAASCSDDDDTPAVQPSLSVTPESISATAATDSYPIAVTANVAWTAAVNSAATWCTLTGDNATGNGTVTVNVAENPTVGEQRAATVTVASGTLTQRVTITQDALPTPPHAATTQTWTFGSSTLTWSDRIVFLPSNCSNSATFTTSDYTTAEYRISNDHYYYSWTCAVNNATNLCPSPWRLPTQSDISTLVDNADYTDLINAWGYGGYATSTSVYYTDTYADYWSSTEYSSNTNAAYGLRYYNEGEGRSAGRFLSANLKYMGYQVRCVK